MKHVMKLCCVVLLSSACFFAQAQSEAEMKAWMDYMTPGEVHKMLAKSDGEWTAEMTSWMAPGAPATNTTAVCTNKMILGGRYQESRFSGNFQGMSFEGISTLSYDNALKKFTTTWIDNMGTGMIILTGTWNNTTMSLNSSGKAVDPVSGKELPMREVFKIIDDNTQQMEMYLTTADGKEYKSMEIKLKRKK